MYLCIIYQRTSRNARRWIGRWLDCFGPWRTEGWFGHLSSHGLRHFHRGLHLAIGAGKGPRSGHPGGAESGENGDVSAISSWCLFLLGCWLLLTESSYVDHSWEREIYIYTIIYTYCCSCLLHVTYIESIFCFDWSLILPLYIYVVCGSLSYECNVTVHCCLSHAYYIAMSMMYRGHIFSLTPTSLQEVKTKHVSLAQAWGHLDWAWSFSMANCYHRLPTNTVFHSHPSHILPFAIHFPFMFHSSSIHLPFAFHSTIMLIILHQLCRDCKFAPSGWALWWLGAERVWDILVLIHSADIVKF